jgi:multimeric flavodoxin WrbA
MNEILLINGSPRKKGNTSVLLAELERSLKGAGVSVKTVRLASMAVAPCNGCAWCQKGAKRHCVQKDDMAGLYHDLLDCQGIVLASPVYWDGITAQLKAFIDRLFAMMKWRDGKAKSLISGKRAAMLLVAGGGEKEG